jgi:hypothetical protein
MSGNVNRISTDGNILGANMYFLILFNEGNQLLSQDRRESRETN